MASSVEYHRLMNRIAVFVPVFLGLVNLASAQPVRAATPALTFMGHSYRLGSFNQKINATWEFVTGSETVNNWTTLITIIDRPDAHSKEELDRLAEARAAFDRAIALADTPAQAAHIRRHLDGLMRTS